MPVVSVMFLSFEVVMISRKMRGHLIACLEERKFSNFPCNINTNRRKMKTVIIRENIYNDICMHVYWYPLMLESFRYMFTGTFPCLEGLYTCLMGPCPLYFTNTVDSRYLEFQGTH